MSVVVGDIDAFRQVNEQHGHAAGDEALQAVARNALKWKRRIDVAARIGGEEFALLLPETDERGAFIVAERLRRATHRSFAEAAVGVTFSFGVATAPAHGTDAVGLLRAADQAVAAAKDLGGDRTVIYSDEVARALDEGTQAGTRAAARHGDRARRGARHPRHRHGPALAHRRPLRGADGARARARRGARRARAARRRAARHRQDRRLGPRAHASPARSTTSEWQEMHTHPEIGARLLSRPEFADLREWILAHHERPDGLRLPARPARRTRSRSRRASSPWPTPTRR